MDAAAAGVELLLLELLPPTDADPLFTTAEVLLRFNEKGRLHSLLKLLASNSPSLWCDVEGFWDAVEEGGAVDVDDAGVADAVEPPNCNLGCRRIPLLFEEDDSIDEDDAVVDIGVNKLSWHFVNGFELNCDLCSKDSSSSSSSVASGKGK